MIRPPMASSEQESPSSDQSNVESDQVHLVLKLEELATIVTAVRAIGLDGFAERLDAILRQIKPAPPDAPPAVDANQPT
jgi:hypothetical protein